MTLRRQGTRTTLAVAVLALVVSACGDRSPERARPTSRSVTITVGGPDQFIEGSSGLAHAGPGAWTTDQEIGPERPFRVTARAIPIESIHVVCESRPCITESYATSLPAQPERDVDLTPCDTYRLPPGTKPIRLTMYVSHMMAAGGDRRICTLRAASDFE